MSGPEPKLPQDPIAGFQNGACLDLRLRFAMQLMTTAHSVAWPPAPADAARLALDIADELFKEANARGLIDPLPEGDTLDDATKAHGERVGRFAIAQQVGQKKGAEEANGPIQQLRRPGLNG